jgi:hypothetical protein
MHIGLGKNKTNTLHYELRNFGYHIIRVVSVLEAATNLNKKNSSCVLAPLSLNILLSVFPDHLPTNKVALLPIYERENADQCGLLPIKGNNSFASESFICSG